MKKSVMEVISEQATKLFFKIHELEKGKKIIIKQAIGKAGNNGVEFEEREYEIKRIK